MRTTVCIAAPSFAAASPLVVPGGRRETPPLEGELSPRGGLPDVEQVLAAELAWRRSSSPVPKLLHGDGAKGCAGGKRPDFRGW